jgi:drug/metabolite transporter (DMT)-like permease
VAALALALSAALIWSSAFAAAKFGIADCPPLLFLVMRFSLAGLIMLGWALSRGIRTNPRELAILSGLGLLNFASYLGMTTVALMHVPSAIVAAIVGVNPVLTVAAGAVMLRERPEARAILALVLGLAGVAIVTVPRALAAAGGGEVVGYVIAVVGLFSLSLGTVLFRRHGTRAEPVLANGVQSLAAGLALLPLSAATEAWSAVTPSLALGGSLAWLIGVVSITGYLIWFRMLRTGSLAAAAVAQFAVPPLGLAYGALLHAEALGVTDLAGLVPILLAVALINLKQKAA